MIYVNSNNSYVHDRLAIAKLRNFFVEFRTCSKNASDEHRLIDILQSVFCVDTYDEVFTLYATLLNQVSYSFNHLEYSHHGEDISELIEVKNAIIDAINQGREEFFLSRVGNSSRKVEKLKLYLDKYTFGMLKAYSRDSQIADSEEDIDESDVDDLVDDINDLINVIAEKHIYYGEKCYLVNLLKKISLILNNYDKLSLAENLLGEMIAFDFKVYSITNLKDDQHFTIKIAKLFGNIINRIIPTQLKLGVNARVPFLGGINAEIQYNNQKSD